jgi:hypothetical protein
MDPFPNCLKPGVDEKADIAYRKIGDLADFRITQVALEFQP